MKTKLMSLAAAAAMFFAVPAAAAVVTINFRGDGGVQSGSTMDFTQDGVTVTVTAGALGKTDEYNVNSRIIQHANGLGSYTGYSYDRPNPGCLRFPALCEAGGISPIVTTDVTDTDNGVNSSGSQNGPGVWEYLALDFHDLEVTLLGVTFGGHGGLGDHALISIPGLEDEIYAGAKSTLVASDFADHSAGMFDFIATDGLLSFFRNSWTLASVTFQVHDPAPSQVPAPMGVPLLGLGVLALGLLRRRAA